MSLDSFMAGPNGGPNPLGDESINIHQWMQLEIAEVIHAPKETHLKYNIMR